MRLLAPVPRARANQASGPSGQCVQIRALMYHDVLGDGSGADASGFPGALASRYKIRRQAFLEHLRAVASAEPDPALLLPGKPPTRDHVLLTFDDGGVTGATIAALALEEIGWRGYFFVPTDFIGRPGFVDKSQIRLLHDRGHVVGSHSCSHPDPMSGLGYERILGEWRRSTGHLAEITGAEVRVASVPGGAYSRAVARAASEAGIRVLFTSEPTSRLTKVGDCLVLGRYTILGSDSSSRAADLARGAWWPTVRPALGWTVRKLVKRIGGKLYYRARRRLVRGTG